MSWIWLVSALSTAGSVVLLVGLFIWNTLGEMATDEMKARLNDIPATLVALALWRLPEHLRDEYRPEWEDDLLAAYEDKNARYPITKLICAAWFVWPLFTQARALRGEFQKVREARPAERRTQKLVALLDHPNRRSMIGPIQLQFRTREVVYRESPDGSFKLDLKTPWPGDSEVTIVDREGDDAFTVIVRDKDAAQRIRALKFDE